jgi:hypothetical protein
MNDKIKLLYYALWFSHPAIQLVIAGLMVHRGLYKKFKFFFGYILVQLVTFAVVFPAYWHRSPAVYYLYWGFEVISVAFGFAVIHEVFVDVFRVFHTLRDLGTVLFKWAGLVMLLVAGVVSVSASSMEMEPWVQAIITSQRCVRFIQVGMVLFLLFFSNYVGVSRRQQSFGIALGFGAFALIELVLISSWMGKHLADPWMNIVNMAAYNGSLLVWLGYIAARAPARDASAVLLQPQRWEQSLSDIQRPLPADSLIPMFEGMVDRALSRTQPDPSPIKEKQETGEAEAKSWGAAAGSRIPFSRAR